MTGSEYYYRVHKPEADRVKAGNAKWEREEWPKAREKLRKEGKLHTIYIQNNGAHPWAESVDVYNY